MALRADGARNRSRAAGLFIAAVPPEDILTALRLRDEQRLTEEALDVVLRPGEQRVIGKILMIGLVVFKALRLPAPLPLQKQGTDFDFPDAALPDRLGEDGLGQTRQGVGQRLCELRHLSHRRGA